MLDKNIKEFRTEKGLTQAELAEKIGVSRGAVYFWEKGINEPTAGYVVKLAKIFGVSVDELLSVEPCEKWEVSPKEYELNLYFSRLTTEQQYLIIKIEKEFLKD